MCSFPKEIPLENPYCLPNALAIYSHDVVCGFMNSALSDRDCLEGNGAELRESLCNGGECSDNLNSGESYPFHRVTRYSDFWGRAAAGFFSSQDTSFRRAENSGLSRVPSSQSFQKLLKDDVGDPTFGGLELYDSALEPDCDSMRPVTGTKLGKNARDVALHSRLRNKELVSDLFIGIPGSNQP